MIPHCKFPPISLLPPSNIRKPKDISNVKYLTSDPWKGKNNKTASTPSQKAGKKYEAKILKALDFLHFGSVIKQPWLAFESKLQPVNWCQPDVLLFTKKFLIICEIKLTHTLDAFWQLEYLYGPVMKLIEPNLPQIKLEITKSFDPNIKYPKEIIIFFSYNEFISYLETADLSLDVIYILQWRL